MEITRALDIDDKHRQNACCEIPTETLLKAISSANEVLPLEISESQPEFHPALQTICGWWNANSPTIEYRRAAYCILWVRREGESEYWGGFHEIRCWPISNGAEFRSRCARWENLILIEYLQGRERNQPWGKQSTLIFGVDDNEYGSAGIPIETCDIAQHSLSALRSFPFRFPEVWKIIQANKNVPKRSGIEALAS